MNLHNLVYKPFILPMFNGLLFVSLRIGLIMDDGSFNNNPTRDLKGEVPIVP